VTDPGILHKSLSRFRRFDDDVRTKTLDLETTLRIELPQPIECGRRQQVDRRAVEKRSRGQFEVGHNVPVVKAVDIRPVLFGFCGRECGRRPRLASTLGCCERDFSVDRLRKYLIDIAPVARHDRAIGQPDAYRRYLRAAVGALDEGGGEGEQRRPFSRVLRGRNLSIGTVDQGARAITEQPMIR